MKNLKVAWVREVFESSWLNETSHECFVFVGDVIPSNEAICEAFDMPEHDNGHDGVSSRSAEVVEYEKTLQAFCERNDNVTVVDIANKRWGWADDEGNIEWAGVLDRNPVQKMF